MKKNCRVILLLVLVIPLFIGTKPAPKLIFWAEGQTLTWNDFQGKADYKTDNIAAITASGIIHFKGCEDGQIIYNVRAYFDPKKSWVKPEALTNYHLKHEQLHFDITELYARKLRQQLAKKDFKCGEEEAFEAFVQNYLMNWRAKQLNYDINTQYSMKKEKQVEWEHKVASELSDHEHYSLHSSDAY